MELYQQLLGGLELLPAFSMVWVMRARTTIEALNEVFSERGINPAERIFNTKDVGDIIIRSTGSRTLEIRTENNH